MVQNIFANDSPQRYQSLEGSSFGSKRSNQNWRIQKFQNTWLSQAWINCATAAKAQLLFPWAHAAIGNTKQVKKEIISSRLNW